MIQASTTTRIADDRNLRGGVRDTLQIQIDVPEMLIGARLTRRRWTILKQIPAVLRQIAADPTVLLLLMLIVRCRFLTGSVDERRILEGVRGWSGRRILIGEDGGLRGLEIIPHL